jgi:23S rRNA pseudouridine955/2504/2580 synthase
VAEPVVIIEDDWILVVDKPSGMAVHPGAGIPDGTLNDWVLDYLGSRAVRNDFTATVAHRLDRETSGVVIVAKRRPAMRKLAKAFEERAVSKRYLALLGGELGADEGEIDSPLRDLERPERTQEAATPYRVEQRFKSATLISCSPRTGRKHQIRRHFLSIGHPVLGDARTNRQALDSWGLRRLFLHAQSLSFPHPRDDAPIHVEAHLPSELTTVLGALSER